MEKFLDGWDNNNREILELLKQAHKYVEDEIKIK